MQQAVVHLDKHYCYTKGGKFPVPKSKYTSDLDLTPNEVIYPILESL